MVQGRTTHKKTSLKRPKQGKGYSKAHSDFSGTSLFYMLQNSCLKHTMICFLTDPLHTDCLLCRLCIHLLQIEQDLSVPHCRCAFWLLFYNSTISFFAPLQGRLLWIYRAAHLFFVCSWLQNWDHQIKLILTDDECLSFISGKTVLDRFCCFHYRAYVVLVQKLSWYANETLGVSVTIHGLKWEGEIRFMHMVSQ